MHNLKVSYGLYNGPIWYIQGVTLKEVNSMKKVLKKKMMISSAKAVHYFSAELVKFVKAENFPDNTSGKCYYNCD